MNRRIARSRIPHVAVFLAGLVAAQLHAAVPVPSQLILRVREGNTTVISGGSLTARINDQTTTFAAPRRVASESSGPLGAVVIIDGTYDLAPAGGGGLGSHRRYVFAAGSPAAIVMQTLSW